MHRFVEELLARPLVGLWLTFSWHSWHRSPVAHDSPHVHAPGASPDRVLIVGDGAATGRGVRTHDLGLPGYLARGLTGLTGRATDVDIVVEGTMTARSMIPALVGLDLARFDIVLVSLGANEALAFTSVQEWRASLDLLLADLDARTTDDARIFVLSIPFFAVNPHIPAVLARIVDRHVQSLNAATDAVVAWYPAARVIPVEQDHAFEPEGAHLYKRWAGGIALRIEDSLDPARWQAGNTTTGSEATRQEALRDLEERNADADADPVLDEFVATARRVLGTSMAAVTLIRSDTQVMMAASGLDPVVLPRAEAFCDTTIRRSDHFFVEDASLDSRYSDFSAVTGDTSVRFYAGYPIESPDGQRIGALCVMDTEPRHLSAAEGRVLQTLAHDVQEHLWRGAPVE